VNIFHIDEVSETIDAAINALRNSDNEIVVHQLQKMKDRFQTNYNRCKIEIPENCKLAAHNTGDGWALAVEAGGDYGGDVLCYLAWPKSWPETVSTEDLRRFGFEIV